MPALYEARSVVDIPVVALGEASMLYACQLGQRTGIVTINPRYITWFHHQIGKYGLESRVTGVHAMTFEPGSFQSLRIQNPRRRRGALVRGAGAPSGRVRLRRHCHPGGGIPMLLFAGIKGHNVDGAPVINGIPIVVKMAELAVKLKRLTGLGVSRVSDYIKAPPEIIEFLANPKGL